MKRNLDLIRSLLEIFEAARPGEVIQTIDGDVDLGGASPVEVLAHISLLIDAGMLEGECHVVPDMPGGRRYLWCYEDHLVWARFSGCLSR